MTFTLSLLNILIIIVGILAIVDGIGRLRGRGASSILAIAELVLGVLLLLTFFWATIAPGLLLIAVLLEVVFIIILVVRGGGRGRGWIGITAVAALINLIVILRLLGVLVIPGVL
jgi:hypothetical protein